VGCVLRRVAFRPSRYDAIW